MLSSLNALILRRGTVVRSQIAKPATIARYLAHVSSLADYHVTYWLHGQSYRVTGEGFLTLYADGRFRPAPAVPAVLDRQALPASLPYLRDMPHTLARLRRVTRSLLDAIGAHTPLEIYAQTLDDGFWYKVYIFAPQGVLRMDTGGESVWNRPCARAAIRYAHLTPVSLDALMTNWQQYDIWPRRAIGLLLYDAWVSAGTRNRSVALNATVPQAMN